MGPITRTTTITTTLTGTMEKIPQTMMRLGRPDGSIIAGELRRAVLPNGGSMLAGQLIRHTMMRNGRSILAGQAP